ncbi:MAG: hypothetical protein R3224_05330 [Balneolaceae bacterium]|nr:hypothetical protein [Balneolaceae bacterium]
MKIGIVGSAERAVAWEKNLRPHQSVSEVIIAKNLKDLGTIDACILIDDSETQLDTLTDAVKAGYHSFLVSKLPLDRTRIEKIYHASEESNVTVQFSHWPSLSPATQWMSQKVTKPRFIHIVREIAHTDFMERDFEFDYYWIDEVALCISWIDGATHQVDVKRTELDTDKGGAIHLFLRFDSGATAGIFVSTASPRNYHKRVVSDHTFMLDCDVQSQNVRAGQASGAGHLFFEKKVFDPSRSAELASTQFLKAIQLKHSAPFGAYDLLRTLHVVDKANKRIGV